MAPTFDNASAVVSRYIDRSARTCESSYRYVTADGRVWSESFGLFRPLHGGNEAARMENGKLKLYL